MPSVDASSLNEILAEEPIVMADFHNDLNRDIMLGSIKKSITPRETFLV